MLRALLGTTLFPVAEWFSGRNVTAQYQALRTASDEAWDLRQRRNRRNLASIVSHAKANVPYYRNVLTKINFDPLRLVEDTKYLQDIPILTKRDIQEHGPSLISEAHKGFVNLQPSQTNGSTGPNLSIYYSPTAKDISAAVTRLTQDWIGFRPNDIQLHLSTKIPDHGDDRSRKIERARRLVTRRDSVEFSTLANDELLRVWDRIAKSSPFLVQGLPSQLYAIAAAVNERYGPRHGFFKVFVSTGETLFDHQRSLIELVFGCRIANRYGSAEFGILAHDDFRSELEDQNDRLMRVVDSHVWVEAYRSLSSDVSPVLVTTLNNRAFPLINYASGDITRVIRRDDGIYLVPVQGRVHDVVEVGGKTFTTQFFQDLLSARCGIADFQIIKGFNNSIKICVVPKSPSQKEKVRQVLSSTFGPLLEIEFRKYTELERVGAQGKFRYVLSADSERKS